MMQYFMQNPDQQVQPQAIPINIPVKPTDDVHINIPIHTQNPEDRYHFEFKNIIDKDNIPDIECAEFDFSHFIAKESEEEAKLHMELEQPVKISFPILESKGKKVKTPTRMAFQMVQVPDDYNANLLPKPIPPEDSHINKQAPLNSTIGRKVNNWFTRLLDQRGEDYISSGKLTVDEVSRNAERILDDMIAGRIDYNKQGPCIIEPVIIETLVNYCYNKLAINSAIQFALGYVYSDYTGKMDIKDPNRLAILSTIDDALSRNITQSIAIVNQDIGIYEILYSKLSYVMTTKNVSSLFSLTNELNNYRKMKMKRY